MPHEPGGVGKVAFKAGRVNVDRCFQILPLFTAIADKRALRGTRALRWTLRGTLLPSDLIADIRFPGVIIVTEEWALVHYDLFAISKVLSTVPRMQFIPKPQ